ncbi:hypothetical protein [Pseudomonas sp. Gutcm_11s]|uniref:hypothetical protein n=1 Tax=Pseudomonas sp. Gutcm_11s TaxID=3026088 RepID=UPI00235F93E6|nr:hypothetical protein [Pseudomonas sp. Gutcm_11s]MDD0841367.1 hypothetical protein [Pseudomonas sp. Gutcm_11s]
MELNKAVIDCMRVLRRRLRDEMSEDIHLNQPDAIAAMLHACLRSGDAETRALGVHLAELSDYQDDSKPANARQYRGHETSKPASEAAAPTDEAQRGQSVRMYRGQRVYN